MKYASLQEIADKLAPDEPVFVIRAQDVLAPIALGCYAQAAKRLGLDHVAQGVGALGVQFAEWQAVNIDRVKHPD